MERFVEEALVLSCVDYGEADRIVTLFTRGRGRMSVFAQGLGRQCPAEDEGNGEGRICQGMQRRNPTTCGRRHKSQLPHRLSTRKMCGAKSRGARSRRGRNPKGHHRAILLPCRRHHDQSDHLPGKERPRGPGGAS
ncbi:MAG: recombination protein O N-terminal domain-containing protein [Luteimonas sp.]|nr:recombination protein O N-terminal domain-containing protein [Luteimonas sp.]